MTLLSAHWTETFGENLKTSSIVSRIRYVSSSFLFGITSAWFSLEVLDQQVAGWGDDNPRGPVSLKDPLCFLKYVDFGLN